MAKNTNNPNRFITAVRHRLYPFLWFIASSNEKILQNSPTQEQDKHFGYGMAILLTAMAATVSGFFAFSLIIRDDAGLPLRIPAMLVAFLWGIIILNLDRIMVGSMKKDISNRRSKELLPVLPRILLAAVIALVISKPIEIELLKDQIVADQVKNREKEVAYTVAIINEEISTRTTNVDSAKQKVESLNEDKRGIKKEEGYLELHSRYNACIDKEKALSKEKEIVQASINGLTSDDRYSYLEEKKDSNGVVVSSVRKLTNKGNSRRGYLVKLRKSKTTKLNKLNCSLLESQRNTYYDNRAAEIDTSLSREKKTILIGSVWIRNKEKGRDSTIEKNDKILKSADKDFFGLLDDLGKLKANNSNIRWASWLLASLFFILEIAPIFVKWISDRGIYDELLEADENLIRNEIRQQASENQIQLESTIANGQAYLNADSTANQQLLEKVMVAQSVIGQKIVEEWQNSELEKLESNREEYLKDHILQS